MCKGDGNRAEYGVFFQNLFCICTHNSRFYVVLVVVFFFRLKQVLNDLLRQQQHQQQQQQPPLSATAGWQSVQQGPLQESSSAPPFSSTFRPSANNLSTSTIPPFPPSMNLLIFV